MTQRIGHSNHSKHKKTSRQHYGNEGRHLSRAASRILFIFRLEGNKLRKLETMDLGDDLAAPTIVERERAAVRLVGDAVASDRLDEMANLLVEKLLQYRLDDASNVNQKDAAGLISTRARVGSNLKATHGALLALVEVARAFARGSSPSIQTQLSNVLDVLIEPRCSQPEVNGSLLFHREVRIRQAAATVLGAWAGACEGKTAELSWLWKVAIPRLFERIDHNLEQSSVPGGPRPTDPEITESCDTADSVKASLLHATEGCKELETSILALRRILESSESGGRGLVDQHWTEFCSRFSLAFQHTNPCVRESIQAAIAAICSFDSAWIVLHARDLAELVRPGLSDDWSQVRLAASVAARSLVLGLEGEAPPECTEREWNHMDSWSNLVPAMCLNRYYDAEGVRNDDRSARLAHLYSLETWRRVMGRSGPNVVARLTSIIGPFYVSQARADNHAVREAACYCMAELATKVEKDSVRSLVPSLLQSMELCFRDEIWHVRDAACTALGDFVGGFPEESRGQCDTFLDLWVDHLADNIASVRADSAVALGKAMDAFGEPCVERLLKELTRMLPSATEQPCDRSKSFESSIRFGVAAPVECMHAHDEDDARNTDQQVRSCSSRAPRVKQPTGCMDHMSRRPKEPWESSDGAVHLLREISRVRPELSVEYIPVLAMVAGLRSFSYYPHLLETIWKQVPAIASNMGKVLFKRHALQALIDPLIDTLERCDDRLTLDAARHCVEQLSAFVGKEIFRGRLTDAQRDVIEHCTFVSSFRTLSCKD